MQKELNAKLVGKTLGDDDSVLNARQWVKKTRASEKLKAQRRQEEQEQLEEMALGISVKSGQNPSAVYSSSTINYNWLIASESCRHKGSTRHSRLRGGQ